MLRTQKEEAMREAAQAAIAKLDEDVRAMGAAHAAYQATLAAVVYERARDVTVVPPQQLEAQLSSLTGSESKRLKAELKAEVSAARSLPGAAGPSPSRVDDDDDEAGDGGLSALGSASRPPTSLPQVAPPPFQPSASSLSVLSGCRSAEGHSRASPSRGGSRRNLVSPHSEELLRTTATSSSAERRKGPSVMRQSGLEGLLLPKYPLLVPLPPQNVTIPALLSRAGSRAASSPPQTRWLSPSLSTLDLSASPKPVSRELRTTSSSSSLPAPPSPPSLALAARMLA